jgi:hypothetical protein
MSDEQKGIDFRKLGDKSRIIEGHKTTEYKHTSRCMMCEEMKNNISSGSASCYECDHKMSDINEFVKASEVQIDKSFFVPLRTKKMVNDSLEIGYAVQFRKQDILYTRDHYHEKYGKSKIYEFADFVLLISDKKEDPKDTSRHEEVQKRLEYGCEYVQVGKKHKEGASPPYIWIVQSVRK